MMIDAVTEPQREVLERIRDDLPLPANRRVSAVALVRLGFLDHDDETNAYSLNAVGRAVFDEDALRANKAADFRVGDIVERSSFNFDRFGQCYTHQWEQATVRKLGKSRLMLDYADGRKGSSEPHYSRHTEGVSNA